MQKAIAKENITRLHPWSDDELLEWADREITEPFRNICEVAGELVHGGSVSSHRANVRLPLMPYKIDWRGFYKFLRDAMPVLLYEPANLISIVLSSDRKRILKAYRVTTKYNNFTSIDELDVEGEEWARLALGLLSEDRGDFLRAELDEHMRAKGEAGVNIVAVSNIEALEVFRTELDGTSPKQKGYLGKVFNAFSKVFKRGLLDFYPFPRGISRIKELTEISDVKPGRMETVFDDNAAPFKTIIMLDGRDYRFAFLWDSENPEELTVNQDLIDEYMPVKRQARILRRKTRANQVITISADMFLNVLYELLARPYPQEPTDLKVLLKKIFYTISRYGDLWNIYPVPVPLKNYVRLPIKALGLPYDINQLSWWFLPGLIVDGGKLGIGQMVRYGMVTMDKDKLLGVVLIDTYNGGLSGIKTLETDEYKDIFAGTKQRLSTMREKLIDAKQRIWEKEGWVDIIMLVQKDLMLEMRRLMYGRALNSMLTLFLAVPPAMRMAKILKKGGFIAYPVDAYAKYAVPYIAKTGRMKLLGTAAQIPFDRKKPRKRGLLYIKETIIAAGIFAGIIALIIKLLL